MFNICARWCAQFRRPYRFRPELVHRPGVESFLCCCTGYSFHDGPIKNLRTLFNKYPEIDDACFILVMKFNEQQVFGTSMQGNVVQRDVAQTTVGFSDHEARICGLDDAEVRRLLGVQAYEYLLAQALSEIGDERSERRELEDNRALIRARLRLLQQQGPGLGSVFGRVAASSDDEFRLETQLTENERQIEAICSQQSVLDAELESLGAVLRHQSATYASSKSSFG